MFLAGGCSSHVWDLEGIPQADGVIELANGWDPKGTHMYAICCPTGEDDVIFVK